MTLDEGRNRPPRGDASQGWRQYAGMGTEFAGAIIGATLLGYWIDHHYDTGSKATITLSLLGVVGGMYNFIRQAMQMSRSTDARARLNERHDHDSERK